MVKESTCNVGDLYSIPGLGRSPGEGNGYPLQYSGFGEVSGHRVLIKRGPGNRGPTECGTTHEATSGMSS